MTAGEQIIYDLKRQIWEEGEKKWSDGWDDGWDDGKDEEKRTIAKAMKDDGVSAKIIAQYTGLTPEQIAAL